MHNNVCPSGTGHWVCGEYWTPPNPDKCVFCGKIIKGKQDEVLPNPEGSPPATGSALVVQGKSTDILKGILEDRRARSEQAGDRDGTLPAEVRRVRRGKFFLSRSEQSTFGSVRYPIFEHYCHGVIIGETVPDEKNDGIWCFASHKDFELIPEFQIPSNWPIYTRTSTGWMRADAPRRIAGEENLSIDKLIQKFNEIKRLS